MPSKTRKRAVGKPSKLTKVVEDSILASLEEGLPLSTAARLAGVAADTVREWIARGKGTDGRPRVARYAVFAQRITRARANAEAALVAQVRKGVTGGGLPDWKASAWLLERTRPEQYGQTVQVKAKVDAELNETIGRLRAGLDPATYERVLGVLADVAAGGDAASDGEEGEG